MSAISPAKAVAAGAVSPAQRLVGPSAGLASPEALRFPPLAALISAS